MQPEAKNMESAAGFPDLLNSIDEVYNTMTSCPMDAVQLAEFLKVLKDVNDRAHDMVRARLLQYSL